MPRGEHAPAPGTDPAPAGRSGGDASRPRPGGDGALVVDRLHVAYGRSVQALRGVSVTVPASGIVTVLGSNGAGKSTLLRAVSGTLFLHHGTLEKGSITYGGRKLNGRDSVAAVRAGIVQVPEGRRVFAGLSVAENLTAGLLGTGGRRSRRARQARERVLELFPVLAERERQHAGLLSGGEQQMLAMGRALMAGPRLLLLDEPSLGLAPKMVGVIASVVREIARQGTAVLLVEQNAAVALDLADTAYVLDVGEVRLTGDASELARTDEVRRLYLGVADEEPGGAPGAVAGQPQAAATPARPTLRRWRG
ncbi:ABC transporter ATP-binding protein [Yinghuangia sp. ASG 101]|uniref:ABC transporter ATP-binding protein n=1 Tax=Yinghuangia sp. ASG 101 TaxID=2896848 RepID=UPI001E61BFF4|nr:ABC transporter ATP-binding protein [Yinghuangia sp. ASG 101]UGQ14322.1 ABC transporter ATP-binding protein [Yinghuangia sp. ASG 101]